MHRGPEQDGKRRLPAGPGGWETEAGNPELDEEASEPWRSWALTLQVAADPAPCYLQREGCGSPSGGLKGT